MNGNNKTNLLLFGATGDLAYRKLLPALYNLYVKNRLDTCDRIIAIGRRDYEIKEYLSIIKDWIEKFARFEKNNEKLLSFFKLIHYVKMDFTNVDEYQKLLKELDNTQNVNIAYYAVAPKFFEIISKGLTTLKKYAEFRIVIEKPFGESLTRAEELNKELEKQYGAKNIYRIDHYLGKEVVRSILTIRATNPIFMQAWNKECIEKVSISAFEEVGVGSRGDYYDQAGAMKDMLQNHLLQILSIIAMELPDSLTDISSIEAKQEELLHFLRPIQKLDIKKDLILAQYEGYTKEEKVSPLSKTETYVKSTVYLDNDRWQDVPFILTTGKKMSTRRMQVVVTFKSINNAPSNELIFEVQPSEGVVLSFNIKEPGESNKTIPVQMEFCQSCNIDYNSNTPEAYERLIDAVIKGDRAWFSTWGQISKSWNYVEALKNEHKKLGLPILIYKQGEDGPFLGEE